MTKRASRKVRNVMERVCLDAKMIISQTVKREPFESADKEDAKRRIGWGKEGSGFKDVKRSLAWVSARNGRSNRRTKKRF
jgi:hypothetical protein